MTISCITCKFYKEINGVFSKRNFGHSYGECHRNAPRINLNEDGSAIWPTVEGDNWCGEYSPELQRDIFKEDKK